ncbi:MAG TPA: tetratricopeptide repeat protein [Pyrinomonadaceae bacterium]|nr:tetratricopeptide repeat protein [Pyrinomonadaceae bacterium]
MLKRILLIASLAAIMIVVIEPLQTAQGIIMTRSQWLLMNSSTNSMLSTQVQQGHENGFLSVLKSPFRAIGKLFGGGKKNKVKLERISEKDIKNFESSPAVQTTNNIPVPAVSQGEPTTIPGMASEQKTSADALETIALQHLDKGRALLNSNDLNGAIGELSMAASANPKLSEASTLLGVAYWRKGLRDLAQRSFENAVRINDDDPQNLNNLGYLLYENGEYESATKYFKRAAKLSPNDPLVWNNLGLAQSERGHFDDAYESFARAQGEYQGHLNIAARLERNGSTKKAIKHLEKALALKPNSTDVLARLVDLYGSTGNEKQAESARSALLAARTLAKTSAAK